MLKTISSYNTKLPQGQDSDKTVDLVRQQP